MQLRCYRCGWSFSIKRDEIDFALQALEEAGGAHYDVRCPRCRHANRLSIEQLRRAAPRSGAGGAAPAGAGHPEAAEAPSEVKGPRAAGSGAEAEPAGLEGSGRGLKSQGSARSAEEEAESEPSP